jgi:hypothetical protein
VHHFGGSGLRSQVVLPRLASAWLQRAPGKGTGEKDKPLHFSGEAKDWPPFKEAIQARAGSHDTTWIFEGRRPLAQFFLPPEIPRGPQEAQGNSRQALRGFDHDACFA